MTQSKAVLGLLAETSIHAGAGQSVGAIDLPIMREAHNDWPCVYGSAMKGALRARAEDRGMKNVHSIFGPDTKNASDFAGALTVGDARLLLLPVRSLTGHFKWVTCPALLRRFRGDLERLGIHATAFTIPDPRSNVVLLPTAAQNSTTLFLEEFRLSVDDEPMTDLLDALAPLIPDTKARDLLKRQLAIVDDDLFSYLARYALPVAAHVSIDNKTKTVAPGALWYEESLPADTLLYVGLTAWASRNVKAPQASTDLLDSLKTGLFDKAPYLQVGGNETVGMGWCRVGWMNAASAPEQGAKNA